MYPFNIYSIFTPRHCYHWMYGGVLAYITQHHQQYALRKNQPSTRELHIFHLVFTVRSFARWFCRQHQGTVRRRYRRRHHIVIIICSTAIYKVKTPSTKCSFILLFSRCLEKTVFSTNEIQTQPVQPQSC